MVLMGSRVYRRMLSTARSPATATATGPPQKECELVHGHPMPSPCCSCLTPTKTWKLPFDKARKKTTWHSRRKHKAEYELDNTRNIHPNIPKPNGGGLGRARSLWHKAQMAFYDVDFFAFPNTSRDSKKKRRSCSH